jgi:hypothetical protein
VLVLLAALLAQCIALPPLAVCFVLRWFFRRHLYFGQKWLIVVMRYTMLFLTIPGFVAQWLIEKTH